MSARMILRPAEGARVRKPDGTLLAENGERLELTPYFARLIADGDVIPGKPSSKTPSSKRQAA